MTATEMAAAANCSSETIRRWIHDGRLPAKQHGISKRFTVDRDVFVRFCEENDVPFHIEEPEE